MGLADHNGLFRYLDKKDPIGADELSDAEDVGVIHGAVGEVDLLFIENLLYSRAFNHDQPDPLRECNKMVASTWMITPYNGSASWGPARFCGRVTSTGDGKNHMTARYEEE